MSFNGPMPNIDEMFKKYNSIHLEKFKAITKAENIEISTQLMKKLTPEESALFDLYLNDLDTIGEYQKHLAAEEKRLKEERAEREQSISDLKNQRDAILTKYKGNISKEGNAYRVNNSSTTSLTTTNTKNRCSIQ